MFRIPHTLTLLFFVGLVGTALFYSGCNKDDDDNLAPTELFSFGPSPALRGGELRFIGRGLDRVTAIVLSDNVQVTTFKQKTSALLVIDIPQETVTGEVVLKTPEGDLIPKSILTISEPIAITSFSPGRARPGDVITINGTYLNLVKSVTFNSRKVVGDTAFISQSQDKIEVRVPADAQSGTITVSNGEADPILVTSETELDVVLPAITQLSPTPVKAGTVLTITGTDLDLTREIVFGGGEKMTEFVSIAADKIEVRVPDNAKDGPVRLVVASLLEVSSTDGVVLLTPTISGVSPNPAKNGQTVTVTGQDLDLVTRVTFGGGKQGTIADGRTATEITVSVPIDATEDVVTFHTAADKSSVSGQPLTLVTPSITAFSSTDVASNGSFTITGEHLDLVTEVRFSGDITVTPDSQSETELTISLAPGAQSGPITLVTTNGSEIVSEQSLNIMASTNIVISNLPASAKPGAVMTIEGEHLDEIVELIFPENLPATMILIKTETMIQVIVPSNVKRGEGRIIYKTLDGQSFETTPINFQGVDDVQDPSLVFFNFDNLGRWWGDTGETQNDPALSLDGSNYFRVNGSLNGWTGFFWRNGRDNFPGNTIGTSVDEYVLKFDINVLEPITGGEFAWRLKGSTGDFWHFWKPWADSGSYDTDGWVTVTIPLTSFYDGANQLSDLSTIDSDFGVAFNNGSSMVNVAIDNVRFERVP